MRLDVYTRRFGAPSKDKIVLWWVDLYFFIGQGGVFQEFLSKND